MAAYDAKKSEWKGVCSMEARRSTLGAAVLNDKLYSVGGFDGTTGLNTCEVSFLLFCFLFLFLSFTIH